MEHGTPFLGENETNEIICNFFSSYTFPMYTFITENLISNPPSKRKRHLKMCSIINQAAFLLWLQPHRPADVFFPLFRMSQLNTREGKDLHLTLSQGTTALCIYVIITGKNFTNSVKKLQHQHKLIFYFYVLCMCLYNVFTVSFSL